MSVSVDDRKAINNQSIIANKNLMQTKSKTAEYYKAF